LPLRQRLGEPSPERGDTFGERFEIRADPRLLDGGDAPASMQATRLAFESPDDRPAERFGHAKPSHAGTSDNAIGIGVTSLRASIASPHQVGDGPAKDGASNGTSGGGLDAS